MRAFGGENNRGFRTTSVAGERRDETLKVTLSGVEIILIGRGMSIINRLRPITKRVEIDAFKSLLCSRNWKAKVCRRKN